MKMFDPLPPALGMFSAYWLRNAASQHHDGITPSRSARVNNTGNIWVFGNGWVLEMDGIFGNGWDLL